MKNFWISGGAILIFAFLFYRMRSLSPQVAENQINSVYVQNAPLLSPSQSTDPAAALHSAVEPDATEATKPQAIKDPSTKALESKPPIEKQIPKLEDVKKEVAADPHKTPRSLIQFSLDLGTKMDIALKSKEASEKMMQELGVCAKGERVKTPPSASAICIQNAYELSEKYSELKKDADSVKEQANSAAQKIFHDMKNLGI